METVEMNPSHVVSPSALAALLGRPDTPLILDVRRPERFAQSPHRLPLSRHVVPDALAAWMQHKTPQTVVLYCVYGHEVSQNAAAQLRAAGWDARYLQGGIESGEPGVDAPEPLQALSGLPLLRQRPDLGATGEAPSRWITRAHPKIDRLACPWLIRRFLDREAGQSRLHADDDHALLAAMMPVYDALYAWCIDQVGGNAEAHNWRPQ